MGTELVSYLDNGRCNTRLTAVAAQPFFLRFADNGSGMRGLNGVEAGEIAAAAATTAAGIAVGRNIAGGAGLDVVVGDVAAIRGLVPECVAFDACARGLAGDLDIGALLVCLHDFVAGSGTGAAVERVRFDGVRADHGHSGHKTESDERELHDEGC